MASGLKLLSEAVFYAFRVFTPSVARTCTKTAAC